MIFNFTLVDGHEHQNKLVVCVLPRFDRGGDLSSKKTEGSVRCFDGVHERVFDGIAGDRRTVVGVPTKDLRKRHLASSVTDVRSRLDEGDNAKAHLREQLGVRHVGVLRNGVRHNVELGLFV